MTATTPDRAADPAARHDLEQRNLATIAGLYQAFGRGDVPAVLDLLADDVSWDADWADSFGQRSPVDHFVPRRGPAQVAEFFAVLAGYTLHAFELQGLMAGGDQVVAKILIELSLPAGGRLRDEELHLWTLRPDGRIVALRHYVDTAKHLAAARGEDTTAR
jgi:uncharacterized protein